MPSATSTAGTRPSHPELGTLADFDRFVQPARDLGMEVALDFAIQCLARPPVRRASTRSGSINALTAR